MLHACSTGAPVPSRLASPFIIGRQSCHGSTLDSILIMEDTEREGVFTFGRRCCGKKDLVSSLSLFSKHWVGGKIGNMHGGDQWPLVLCPVFGLMFLS